ncbi:hypothetical protein ACFLSJ_00125 [Verrucomicrobiota bacterium]
MQQPRVTEETILVPDTPVVVAASDPEEKRWGWYQFPSIRKDAAGRIIVGFNVTEDSIRSYGKGGVKTFASSDSGKTWDPIEALTHNDMPADVSNDRFGLEFGVLLPNGDRIAVSETEAVPVSDIDFPEPVGWLPSGYDGACAPAPVYRLKDLPGEWQGFPLKRLAKGAKEWTTEFATIDDPYDLRSPVEGLFHITVVGRFRVAHDGSVIACVYPGAYMRDDGSIAPRNSVLFWRSTDYGRTWRFWSRLTCEPDPATDELGELHRVFGEPYMEILHDGSFYCVVRTTDGLGVGPLYAARSTDMGRTWSKPVAIAPNGVEPQLLKLANNTLILSAGRPGVQVRVSPDGLGREWSPPLHLVQQEMMEVTSDTCGYTKLLATGPDTFMVVYSDFRRKDDNGCERKSILVCEIQVKRVARPAKADSPEHAAPAAEQEVLRYYHDRAGGALAVEIPMVDGRAHGVMKKYYCDGAIAMEVPMRHGIEHGIKKFYYRTGQLWQEVEFRKGWKHGIERFYDRAGFLTTERYYLDWQECSKGAFLAAGRQPPSLPA